MVQLQHQKIVSGGGHVRPGARRRGVREGAVNRTENEVHTQERSNPPHTPTSCPPPPSQNAVRDALSHAQLIRVSALGHELLRERNPAATPMGPCGIPGKVERLLLHAFMWGGPTGPQCTRRGTVSQHCSTLPEMHRIHRP